MDDQHAIYRSATYPGPQAQPGANSNVSELQKPLLQDQLTAKEFTGRYTVYSQVMLVYI